MARLFLLLLSAVAVLSSAVDTNDWQEDETRIVNQLAGPGNVSPNFHQPETAPYTVLKKLPTYEIRKYPATKWVCASSEVDGYDLYTNGVAIKLYWKLFNYTRGTNDKKTQMHLTSPVTFHFVPESHNRNQITECFYISAKYQQDPPKPAHTDVFIQNRAALQAIVAARTGYPSARDWGMMGKTLIRDAYTNGDLGYNIQSPYGVKYDPPYKFWERRNELWYVKKT